MKLWIVADVQSDDGAVWELRGVFGDEVLALAVQAAWNHCLFSVSLNELLPDKATIPPDARYPIAEE